MEMNDEDFEHIDNGFSDSKRKSIDYIINTTNQDNMDMNSMYCTGFRAFVTQKNICDTIDARSVYSKGLEITFTEYLDK